MSYLSLQNTNETTLFSFLFNLAVEGISVRSSYLYGFVVVLVISGRAWKTDAVSWGDESEGRGSGRDIATKMSRKGERAEVAWEREKLGRKTRGAAAAVLRTQFWEGTETYRNNHIRQPRIHYYWKWFISKNGK